MPTKGKAHNIQFKAVPKWDFDAKDTQWKKYGNFSTTALLKMVSKYNKKIKGEGDTCAKTEEVAKELVLFLNKKLEQ